eukprot:s2105_g13.t1
MSHSPEVPEPQVVEAFTQVVRPVVESRTLPALGECLKSFERKDSTIKRNPETSGHPGNQLCVLSHASGMAIIFRVQEVPYVVTEPVERLQEVMQRPLLEEVAVPIPKVLTYEAVRQTVEPSVEQSGSTNEIQQMHTGICRLVARPQLRCLGSQVANTGSESVPEQSTSSTNIDVHKKRPVKPLRFEEKTLIFESQVILTSRRKCQIGAALSICGFNTFLASLSLHGALSMQLCMAACLGLIAMLGKPWPGWVAPWVKVAWFGGVLGMDRCTIN